MATPARVKITCQDCGVVYERARSILCGVPADFHWRCTDCMKAYKKSDEYLALNKEKFEKIAKARSERMKAKWANVSDEYKEDFYNRAANTRKSRSDEEKELTKAMVQETWKTMDAKKKSAHGKKISKAKQSYWDSLSDEDNQKIREKFSTAQRNYFDSMSDDERAAFYNRKLEERKTFWGSLSDEEYKRLTSNMSDSARARWDNASKEEQQLTVERLHDGLQKWFDVNHGTVRKYTIPRETLKQGRAKQDTI